MITRLSLEHFKSFCTAELLMGGVTILIGANATGKSNIRDALRFLHGLGRGYTLAEIIGGADINGTSVWSGIRGGARELAYHGMARMVLEADVSFPVPDHAQTYSYHIEVNPGHIGDAPQVSVERLTLLNEGVVLIRAEAHGPGSRLAHLIATVNQHASSPSPVPAPPSLMANGVVSAHTLFGSMRFLDLDMTAIRQPSQPGQSVLTNRGTNLSSVLHDLCRDIQQKQTLISWIRALTDLPIDDLEFPPDQIGRVLTTLVETTGQRYSIYSASDGTVRLLALLAALLSSDAAQFFFLEDLEHGMHPTQLHLVIDMMERIARERGIQIVATTHAPQSMRCLSPETLEHVALTYRLEGQPDTCIHRIVDLPHAREVIATHDIATLYESRWFEESAAFLADQEADA